MRGPRVIVGLFFLFNVIKESGVDAGDVDGHFVRKGYGSNEKHFEEYQECVAEKEDFVYYDIDLFENEYLDISCKKGTKLEPISEGKYFTSSSYINELDGAYAPIDEKEKARLDSDLYKMSLKLFEKENFWRIKLEKLVFHQKIKPFYLHCYDKSKVAVATVQINIRYAPEEEEEKDEEFEFDKYKYSPTGKKLTYIKSMRPGKLIKTICKDSKLKVTYSDKGQFREDRYRPIKKLFKTNIEYYDISKEIVEEVEGKHVINLVGDNKVVEDLKRCEPIITCEKNKDRKLIYVYPKYTEFKGLNVKTKEIGKQMIFNRSKIVENGIEIDTKDHKELLFNVPYGNVLEPQECPRVMHFEGIKDWRKTIRGVKVTKISKNMEVMDLSRVTTYKEATGSCRAARAEGDREEVAVSLKINPTCDITNKSETESEYRCTFFADLKGTIVVRSSEEESKRIDFKEAFYYREEKEGREVYKQYGRLSLGVSPVITKKGKNEVHITFKGNVINYNPLYLVSSEEKGEEVRRPDSVVKIYLSNAKAYIGPNNIVLTEDKIVDQSKFYHLNVEDSSFNIQCEHFFQNPGEAEAVVYPRSDNQFYVDVSDGMTDPKLLEPREFNEDLIGIGYEFKKTKGRYQMEVKIKNNFIYSNPIQPLYFICAKEVKSEDWWKSSNAYAVIAVDPNYEKYGSNICGIKRRDSAGKYEVDEKCEYELKNYESRYTFYCPSETEEEKEAIKKNLKKKLDWSHLKCRYESGKKEKIIEDSEFKKLLNMEEEYEGDKRRDLMVITEETPIFGKKMGDRITCVCREKTTMTVSVKNPEKSGFLEVAVKMGLIGLIVTAFYNF